MTVWERTSHAFGSGESDSWRSASRSSLRTSTRRPPVPCPSGRPGSACTRIIQRTRRGYGDKRDTIQPGEKVWLFTYNSSADRKWAVPYAGPWQVVPPPSGTLHTIRPEGGWCRQPKDLTLSLNRLKRCRDESDAPQGIDHDQRKLEDANDDAEVPLQNAWVTNAGAAAGQTLNQEVGDVHAPSVRGKSKSAAGPPPAPRPFSRYRDTDDIAPSIVVQHELTNIVGPDMSGVAHHSSSRANSATMTAPDLTAASMPHPDPLQFWTAPRMQFPFDKSAQVRPCGSQVLEEGALRRSLRFQETVSSPRHHRHHPVGLHRLRSRPRQPPTPSR